MNVAVLIAEYNPFHRGHEWQLSELRRRGISHIAVIMSGNFVQRGDAALLEKGLRARMALLGGADLVLELPLPYACAGAQRFAFGGVCLAAAMGCGDVLAFGAETPDLSLLRRGAALLSKPELYREIRRRTGEGTAFAPSRLQAAEELAGQEVASLFREPNNILAMEYLNWMDQLHAPLSPLPLPRIGAGHHGEAAGNYASASFLREKIAGAPSPREAFAAVSPFLPRQSGEILREALEAGRAPGSLFSHDRLLLGRLQGLGPEDFGRLPDVSEGLEHRLARAAGEALSGRDMLERMKTKRYPTARLRRLILWAFLGADGRLGRQRPPYLRVMGFTERGEELLSCMKEAASLPVSHSYAVLERLGGAAQAFAAQEAEADKLYRLLLPSIAPYRAPSPVKIKKGDAGPR